MHHVLSLAALLLTLAAQQAFPQVGTQASRRLGPPPSGASQADAPPQPTNPADLGTIEGRVLNLATGEPLRKATVALRRTDAPPNSGGLPTMYATSTDDTGGFAMKDLDPGQYRLSVNRTGFVNTEYGSRGPGRLGTTLTLSPGQHMQGLVFKLTPHAVITGRVVDADGEPMASVQVQPMRYQYNNGRKQLFPSGGASTNDLGEYRIFGLAPGRYFLSATPRPDYTFEFSVDRSANPAPEEGFAATYYPGAADTASASAVEVTPGSQIHGMDFRLSKTRTVRVRGRVNNLSGGDPGSINIMVSPRDQMFYTQLRRTVARHGDFEIRGLAPGSYTLTATIFESGKSFTGRQTLDLGTHDLENITITISPPMELAGQVRVEGPPVNGGTPPDLSTARIRLWPRGEVMPFGPTPTARVADDKGGFVLTNVSPDSYNVNVTGLPDGYYVKSIVMGQEDVVDSGLNLVNGAAGPITIVLRPGAGQIDGAVLNDDQKPAPGATVVLIPKDEKHREQAQSYKNTTTDQYGRFTLKNIDPGDYKLFAWEDVESGAYMDPDFVKPVEAQGTSITIREGSQENQQLKWIPADGTRPSEAGQSSSTR